jgi:CubicO group peptidase (beta-lactamase class C family)
MTRPGLVGLALGAMLATAPLPLPAQGASRAAIDDALARLDTAAIAAMLLEEMRTSRAPGAAVAVVIGDRVVFERAAGVASIETGAPLTTETLFRLGSTTKMFTGLTALTLAERGRLSLTRPIGEYARGLSAPLARLTLQQLLTHSAGMVNEAAGDGPHDPAALGQRMRGWGAEHIFTEPGEIYSYSGPGYWLAGYAIEQAGGAWYARLVDSLVLSPVGMRRSGFEPLRAFTHQVALDHRVGPDGTATVVRPFPDDVTTWASGSLFSSVRELAAFTSALLNGGRLYGREVLSPSAVARLMENQVPVPGGPCSYTYGLSACEIGGVRVLSHSGFRGGTGSVITLVPQHGVAVIVLANRNGGIFRRTERAVLEMLVPFADGDMPDVSPPRAFTAETIARITGRYVNGPDTLHLLVRNGKLLYRYGTSESATRPGSSENEILVLNPSGDPVQRFLVIRAPNGGIRFLHDGLSAFRSISR